MHEFVLDVLGRDTDAAKIFHEKSGADFKSSYVVSFSLKVVVCVILICMNLVCLLYAMLRGYIRGIEWQRQYLLACVMQCLVEMLLFETTVVIWCNVVVPQVVLDEVTKAYYILVH